MLMKLLDLILHVDEYLNILILNYGAYVYMMMFFVVFVETGVVIMPFLPGDSLLFVAGTFAAVGSLDVMYLFLLLSAAAIIGDTVNYWVGSYFGEKVFAKFIKKEHMDAAKSFYEKHGKKAIVFARFVPIMRTLAPFVAGIGKMNYRTFLMYNVMGGVTWVLIFVFAGYSFGTMPFVKENLTAITLGIIIVFMIPAFVEYIKFKRKKS